MQKKKKWIDVSDARVELSLYIQIYDLRDVQNESNFVCARKRSLLSDKTVKELRMCVVKCK